MIKPLKNKYHLFIFIMATILIAGGLIGLAKRAVPGLEGWGLNALIGLQGRDDGSVIIVVYSITLALLEIISSIGLLLFRRFGIKLVMITLSISAAGSLVSIAFGDLGAAFSLAVRIAGIVIFSRPKIKALFS